MDAITPCLTREVTKVLVQADQSDTPPSKPPVPPPIHPRPKPAPKGARGYPESEGCPTPRCSPQPCSANQPTHGHEPPPRPTTPPPESPEDDVAGHPSLNKVETVHYFQHKLANLSGEHQPPPPPHTPPPPPPEGQRRAYTPGAFTPALDSAVRTDKIGRHEPPPVPLTPPPPPPKGKVALQLNMRMMLVVTALIERGSAASMATQPDKGVFTIPHETQTVQCF